MKEKTMDKMKMHSPDLSRQNVEKLTELFPNCVTETRDENGELVSSIDFDLLRQELSDHIVEGPQERYQIDWPGKREAILIANAPIAKTLRPARDESVDFDTTKNLFIEGDNLDALKMLQETYLNKVKMIYIDPPYNTGKDFIYEDDFAEDTQSYLQRSNQVDEEGNRLVTNNDSNGRFHSDWLSMMYPRLKLARNLLREDGVIAISIDDNEVANLYKVLCEIFGEYIKIISVKMSEPTGVKMASVNKEGTLAKLKEYVLLVGKTPIRNLHPEKIKKPRWDDEYRTVITNITKNEMQFIKNSIKNENLTTNEINYINDLLKKAETAHVNIVSREEKGEDATEEWLYENAWRIVQFVTLTGAASDLAKETKINFNENVPSFFLISTANNKYYIINGEFNIKTPLPRCKVLFADDYLEKHIGDFWEDIKTTGLDNEGHIPFKNGKKPIRLINRIIDMVVGDDDVIMDFFAGSGTTAETVLQLNLKKNKKLKYILMQINEKIEDTKEQRELLKFCEKNSITPTISEMSKERIRRAGKKIMEENPDANLDIGFRVLKVDTSNMEDVYYFPDDIEQADLLADINNIKPDRTIEDLLFQVLLDWGVDLTLPIAKENIHGKSVYFVDDNALAACFEQGIDEALVKELAQRHPMRVVFRDNGFASDAVKINVTQIFKLMSPDTDVRTI